MLHHEAAGEGPPLLLIHAGVADSRMWDPQWHGLAEHHRVIRADLYGFGRSPEPDFDHVLAEALVEVLDAQGVDEADVVGASFGGLVALELATLHPHRVRRLVLLSPFLSGLPPTPDFEDFARQEQALVEAGQLEAATELIVETWLGPEAHESVAEMVRVMQRNAFELQQHATAEPREVELIVEDIRNPTVIYTGAHDFEYFHRVGEHLEAKMPNARRITLDWAGHLPTLERPRDGLQLLREALGSGGG